MAQNSLTDRTISEIKLLSEIARANNGHISIQELATLTSAGLDAADIRAAWETTHDLRSSYDLRQDFVISRAEALQENSILSAVLERKFRARQFIQSAKCFQRFCRTKGATVLAVSGSTSYYSTLPGDDLDFFTITEDGALWVFLFRSMIFARIYHFLHPETPRTCFSYAIDRSFAKKAFATDDPLFARDALNAVVLCGHVVYDQLLRRSPWMNDYFPRLYQFKIEQGQKIEEHGTGKSSMRQVLNSFLFLTLGQYLRVKSALLNRRLQGQARTSSLFALKSGPDHFIFESVRYLKLRQMYRQFGRRTAETRATATTVM